MSRDPNEGYLAIPATLHKYLYAGGDPVDVADPRGRDMIEFVSLARKIVAIGTGVAFVGGEVAELYDCIAEGVGSLIPELSPVISSPSKGCAIRVHDEWPTEPPTWPGPPRWRQPWERGGPGDPGEPY
jgi:hypothetical protein